MSACVGAQVSALVTSRYLLIKEVVEPDLIKVCLGAKLKWYDLFARDHTINLVAVAQSHGYADVLEELFVDCFFAFVADALRVLIHREYGHDADVTAEQVVPANVQPVLFRHALLTALVSIVGVSRHIDSLMRRINQHDEAHEHGAEATEYSVERGAVTVKVESHIVAELVPLPNEIADAFKK